MDFRNEEIYFSTVTVNKWVSVFHDFPATNFYVLDSFEYLTNNNQVEIYAFVIMRDHIHIAWKITKVYDIRSVVTSFKQYAATRILDYLKITDVEYLNYFTSERRDRKHKFWKQKTDNFRLLHRDILMQKIVYIHYNPTKGEYKINKNPEGYFFSSAKAYFTERIIFPFLTLLERVPYS